MLNLTEKSVTNGTIVGAFSDYKNGVSLGYKEDFTPKEISTNHLTSGSRQEDEVTS